MKCARWSIPALCLACVPAAQAAYITTTPEAPDPLIYLPGTTTFVGGVELRDITLSRTGASQSLGSGGFTINSFFDIFTELSLNSGGSWTPVSGNGPLAEHVGPGAGGSPTVYPTEITSMGLTFGGGVMLRESPTLASLGQTSITPIGGNEYRAESFFDVFLEISLDSGNTWLPQTGSAPPAVGNPEPASLGILALGAVGLLTRRRRHVRSG